MQIEKISKNPVTTKKKNETCYLATWENSMKNMQLKIIQHFYITNNLTR